VAIEVPVSPTGSRAAALDRPERMRPEADRLSDASSLGAGRRACGHSQPSSARSTRHAPQTEVYDE